MTAMCVSAVYSYHFLYLQENMTGAFLKHLIRMFSPFKFQFSASSDSQDDGSLLAFLLGHLKPEMFICK